MADEHLVEEHGSEEVELTDAVVEKDDQPASMQVDIANLTEEELDHIADTAIDALQGILKYFDVGEVMIDEYEGDERELILDITGDNLAVLMGRRSMRCSSSSLPLRHVSSGSGIPWSSMSRDIRIVNVKRSNPWRVLLHLAQINSIRL